MYNGAMTPKETPAALSKHSSIATTPSYRRGNSIADSDYGLEPLIPRQHSIHSQAQQHMSPQSQRAIPFEQMEMLEKKKSYGIGGAGNIRRPSDVIYPTKPNTNPDGTPRRRSSVWSTLTTGTSSPSLAPKGGKLAAVFGVFGKKHRHENKANANSGMYNDENMPGLARK